MKIIIKKNAYIFADSSELRNFLTNNEGAILEVETNCLFENQYNIKEPSIMVYDSMISEVIDDARINRGKCNYCGTVLNSGDVCNKHADCAKYGIYWFTPDNTYFLKYPKGVKSCPVRFSSIDPLNIKIGSYFLESFPDLDYYRLSNCRKTIHFKYDGKNFFINNRIGYTEKKSLDVPGMVVTELKRKLYALKEKYIN